MRFPLNISAHKDFDAIGFGLNAVDHLIVVPEYPAFDSKVRLTEYTRAAGGQTASAMVALQRLGMSTAYAGSFGSDEAGSFGLQTLKDEGVDIKFARVLADTHTQVAFIIIDGRNGERTIIWDRDERLAYASEAAPIELASRGRVLHMDAHDPPACTRMAQAARNAGVVVSIDVDNIYEGLPDLLPLVDLLISSAEFPRRLTGISDHRASLVEMKWRYGCALVGMTLGPRGSLVYCEGQFIETPAFAAPGGCRDTTGAGDAFHAGFLYGMLQGHDVETSLKLGNGVAALKCRALGARTTLPDADELNEFIASAIRFEELA
ncbi:MAG: sulfofructose kinase [Blastocatellia bacterium]|jgi:sugar/nucleoside kinase (ribokinase family)|nr:sulfofructose kinase [Blastocatellia bacterium]